jgi:FkbM family methyltransferase
MARDIRSGTLTEPELDLIPHAVNAGDLVLDIGANYGMWTAPLSRAVREKGRVYAFEPIPFTVNTLKTVVKLLRLRNVEIVSKACGEESGTVQFTLPVQDSGAISAGQAHFATRDDERQGKENHVHWQGVREVECEVVALDEFLPEVEELTFLKLDIEGAEIFACRGAQKLIAEHMPTIVCEINRWFLEGYGLSVDELLRFFQERGYSPYRYRKATARLEEVRDSASVVEDNYVFVHPHRADRLQPLMPTVSEPASQA